MDSDRTGSHRENQGNEIVAKIRPSSVNLEDDYEKLRLIEAVLKEIAHEAIEKIRQIVDASNLEDDYEKARQIWAVLAEVQ